MGQRIQRATPQPPRHRPIRLPHRPERPGTQRRIELDRGELRAPRARSGGVVLLGKRKDHSVDPPEIRVQIDWPEDYDLILMQLTDVGDDEENIVWETDWQPRLVSIRREQ